MLIQPTGHHGGDAQQMCESLVIHSETWTEAKRVALLNRVLSDSEMRERLFDAAQQIEDSAKAEGTYVGCSSRA